jgi:hypothetical protein
MFDVIPEIAHASTPYLSELNTLPVNECAGGGYEVTQRRLAGSVMSRSGLLFANYRYRPNKPEGYGNHIAV